MNIVTKKIISMLSLILFINLQPLKRYGGTKPSMIPECQLNIIGERSADIHYYMYL